MVQSFPNLVTGQFKMISETQTGYANNYEIACKQPQENNTLYVGK